MSSTTTTTTTTTTSNAPNNTPNNNAPIVVNENTLLQTVIDVSVLNDATNTTTLLEYLRGKPQIVVNGSKTGFSANALGTTWQTYNSVPSFSESLVALDRLHFEGIGTRKGQQYVVSSGKKGFSWREVGLKKNRTKTKRDSVISYSGKRYVKLNEDIKKTKYLFKEKAYYSLHEAVQACHLPSGEWEAQSNLLCGAQGTPLPSWVELLKDQIEPKSTFLDGISLNVFQFQFQDITNGSMNGSTSGSKSTSGLTVEHIQTIMNEAIVEFKKVRHYPRNVQRALLRIFIANFDHDDEVARMLLQSYLQLAFEDSERIREVERAYAQNRGIQYPLGWERMVHIYLGYMDKPHSGAGKKDKLSTVLHDDGPEDFFIFCKGESAATPKKKKAPAKATPKKKTAKAPAKKKKNSRKKSSSDSSSSDDSSDDNSSDGSSDGSSDDSSNDSSNEEGTSNNEGSSDDVNPSGSSFETPKKRNRDKEDEVASKNKKKKKTRETVEGRVTPDNQTPKNVVPVPIIEARQQQFDANVSINEIQNTWENVTAVCKSMHPVALSNRLKTVLGVSSRQSNKQLMAWLKQRPDDWEAFIAAATPKKKRNSSRKQAHRVANRRH